ncbi:MAG: M48 family metallopeptidase [Actinomycetota bacterium]|nr:M48 family metallopeptidase [Actinomycetota bacterium]
MRSNRRRKTVSARVVDGTVRVLVPAGMAVDEESRLVELMVGRVIRKLTANHIDLIARSRDLARRYRFPKPDSIEWSERQWSRWGSCTPSNGRIRISNRLAEMPGWVLDYVIVHELAHLEEANHGARFRDMVSRYELSERATGYLMAMTRIGDSPPGTSSTTDEMSPSARDQR